MRALVSRKHARSVTSTPKTCLGEKEKERVRAETGTEEKSRQRGSALVSRRRKIGHLNAKDLLG
jgi:hypothetical protein